MKKRKKKKKRKKLKKIKKGVDKFSPACYNIIKIKERN